MKKDDKFIKHICTAIIALCLAYMQYRNPYLGIRQYQLEYMSEQEIMIFQLIAEFTLFALGIYNIILAIIDTIKNKDDEK